LHVPVLLQEILSMLRPKPGGVYLDGTLGAGGYSQAILEHSAPDGRVWALDLDPEAVRIAAGHFAQFAERFTAVHGGFQNARAILARFGVHAIDGAVLDLGLSSDELADPERGFSFRSEGPLDMRFDTASGETVLDYLQRISVRELEEILATYGQERYCKKLARGIVAARDRLATTKDLAQLVERLLGGRRGKIHPATRTFQALRIAVNREMENLAEGLEGIPLLLRAGGRFCVVSYHSLEDRQVKLSFVKRKREPLRWKLITPKPLRPTNDEVRVNPRSRSARMRVLEAVEGVS
jgi:16S rRNA (cytosine1402-N4)-methyltransferase